jgi:hypothetical protein
VPSKRALKKQEMTEAELMKRGNNDPRARQALNRWHELKAKGAVVKIWYSDHNGYQVVDMNEEATRLWHARHDEKSGR